MMKWCKGLVEQGTEQRAECIGVHRLEWDRKGRNQPLLSVCPLADGRCCATLEWPRGDCVDSNAVLPAHLESQGARVGLELSLGRRHTAAVARDHLQVEVDVRSRGRSAVSPVTVSRILDQSASHATKSCESTSAAGWANSDLRGGGGHLGGGDV